MLFRFAVPNSASDEEKLQQLQVVDFADSISVLTNGDSVEAAIANARLWLATEFLPARELILQEEAAQRKATTKCGCGCDEDDDEECTCSDGSTPTRKRKKIDPATLRVVDVHHVRLGGRAADLVAYVDGVFIVPPAKSAAKKRKYTRRK